MAQAQGCQRRFLAHERHALAFEFPIVRTDEIAKRGTSVARQREFRLAHSEERVAVETEDAVLVTFNDGLQQDHLVALRDATQIVAKRRLIADTFREIAMRPRIGLAEDGLRHTREGVDGIGALAARRAQLGVAIVQEEEVRGDDGESGPRKYRVRVLLVARDAEGMRRIERPGADGRRAADEFVHAVRTANR